MEDRYIVLAWRGDNSKTFEDIYDIDDVFLTVNSLKEDKDVEHIEVVHPGDLGAKNFRWSNPNSNPKNDSF
jgi:hypothetical protein